MFLVKILNKETGAVKSESRKDHLTDAIDLLAENECGLILDLDKEVRPGSLSHPIIYAKNI
jgi:hypothetical protein